MEKTIFLVVAAQLYDVISLTPAKFLSFDVNIKIETNARCAVGAYQGKPPHVKVSMISLAVQIKILPALIGLFDSR